MPDPDDVEDKAARTDVLHDEDDAAFVVEQQNVGCRNMKGGGEWPDPDAPAEAPAPGSVPSEGAEIAANRGDGDEPTQFKDVLEVDPVAGGSKSTPD
jgi:hypothetical protein